MIRDVTFSVWIFLWIGGVVLASGFWSTLCAVTIPFWAFYLLAERLMEMAGIIA